MFSFTVLCPWTVDTSKIPKLFWLFPTATVQELVPGGDTAKGPWKVMEPLDSRLKRCLELFVKDTKKPDA